MVAFWCVLIAVLLAAAVWMLSKVCGDVAELMAWRCSVDRERLNLSRKSWRKFMDEQAHRREVLSLCREGAAAHSKVRELAAALGYEWVPESTTKQPAHYEKAKKGGK